MRTDTGSAAAAEPLSVDKPDERRGAEDSYRRIVTTSQRVYWSLDDALGGPALDFSKPLLPEGLARVRLLPCLTPPEQLALNHVRARSYLSMFELFERGILPFIEEHAVPDADGDGCRSSAFSQFAAEEAKHIELFSRWGRRFDEDFGVTCGTIGLAEEIGAVIRSHGAAGVALFILAVEWATQRHYIESVRSDELLDSGFRELLRLHWLEECQHAKLDALLFAELTARLTADEIETGIDDFLQICAFIDVGLGMQINLDLLTLERAIGRDLPAADRATVAQQQHQAMRWTFLGSALANDSLLASVGAVTRAGRRMIEQATPSYC